jgi:ribosomal protein S18 acetylase RimI-like enzyme
MAGRRQVHLLPRPSQKFSRTSDAWYLGIAERVVRTIMEAERILIRRASTSDIEGILALWRDASATPSVTDTADGLRRALSEPSLCMLVAEVDGALAGSIIGTFDGWRGNVYRLAVHPQRRRRGIARALVREVERWLTERGGKRVTALVEKDHPWAMGFWAAADYQLDGRIARYCRNL